VTSFVVEYNRRTGAVDVRAFDGVEGHRSAIKYRMIREADVSEDVEVVALLSDSLDSIKRTHSRYFSRFPDYELA